jgi:TonB family protein
MHIASRLPQKFTCVLILVFVSMVSTHSLAQSDQAKDKPPPQEKASEEKKPDTTAQRGGIAILSDTMGFDFGPYMKRLKYAVQSHWGALIPEVAMPPIMKSGTVTIELAVMKDGRVQGMKLVKSSGDSELDRAAWGGITDAIPLPALPLGFKGDHLQLRCSFAYNPAAKPTPLANEEPKK